MAMGKFVVALISNPYFPFCTPKFVPEALIVGFHITAGTKIFVVTGGFSLGLIIVLEENRTSQWWVIPAPGLTWLF
jgi:hypothetical protein